MIFFSLKNTKIGDYLLLSTYFDNFDFWCTLFSKNATKFWWPNQQAKSLEYFYGHFHRHYSSLNSAPLSCSSEVTLNLFVSCDKCIASHEGWCSHNISGTRFRRTSSFGYHFRLKDHFHFPKHSDWFGSLPFPVRGNGFTWPRLLRLTLPQWQPQFFN